VISRGSSAHDLSAGRQHADRGEEPLLPHDRLPGLLELGSTQLKRGNDELAEWAKGQPDLFLPVSDDDTQQAFGAVATHVAAQAGAMKAGALEEFLAGADPWLIAKAMALKDAVVVTHEQFNPQIRRKFSIPNVCQHFGVQWIDTFELLSRTDARFVLAD
jgi:hypothetical protein